MFNIKMLPFAILLVLGSAACSQDLSWLNPESLPPPLDQPLKLLATTDKTGQGHDYFTLKPGKPALVGAITGPAVIFRIWSTSSKSTQTSLDLVVDGTPRKLYAAGKPVGLAAGDPLRAMDKQAYWSYAPIVVWQQAIFMARSSDPKEEIKLFVQADYRSVSREQASLIKALDVKTVGMTVASLMADPLYGVAKLPKFTGTVTAGQPWTAPLQMPALVRTMVLNVGDTATAAQLMATRLTITVDGNRTMDVPLGALFCQYWKFADYTSLGAAVKGKNLMLRLPMPVAKSLSFALSAFGSTGAPLKAVTVDLYSDKLSAAPKYHLCAQYFSQVSVKDQPIHMLDATGPGLFVGSNLAVDGGPQRKTFAFLEGNDQFYVDGALKPTLEGTGTEDYFNNAWYFENGVLARPFHGVTFIQPKDPSRVSAYRWMLSDCLPFNKSLKFDLQHGSHNTAPGVLYSGVVFWYQAGPAQVAAPAMAAAPGVAVAPTEPARSFYAFVRSIVLGAIILVIFGLIVSLIMKRRRRNG